MHQIFADLCPFESFCKLFVAYCLEVIVCRFYFMGGLLYMIALYFANSQCLLYYCLLLASVNGLH